MPHREKTPLVLFGNGSWAEFVGYILAEDSDYELVAFTVDEKFLAEDTLLGRPVVPFHKVETLYDPDRHMMMNSVGFIDGNKVRARKYAEGKAKGYRFGSYVSSRASTWTNVEIGENCFIHEHAVVQPFVKIGNNCHILSSANISHHSRLGDHCFVAGDAMIGGSCQVGDYAFLAMNSVVRDNTTLADHVTLGAGGVLTSDATQAGVYVGIPARQVT